MERNPERATRRVRAYFGAMEKAGHPIEETVQELRRAVGCGRRAIYDWKGGISGVSQAYSADVERALDKLQKKHGIKTE